MADCLTDETFTALVQQTGPTRLSPEQQAHLLGCDACRGHLLQAFRDRAQATLPPSLDETMGSAGGGHAESQDVPVTSERYGLSAQPEVLGRGGYGKVLLARDLTVGRDVALKCLRSKVVASPQRLQAEARLLREARVIGQLEHPGIVPLYDVGRTAQGQLFYTMRRIRGRTLGDAVDAATGFSARLRLLPHVLAACHAVAYAHSRGVIHRDLKPHNVMVDRFGETSVIDWGLASTRELAQEPEPGDPDSLRLVGGGESLSDGRGRLGTPAYMSPEQLSGVRALIDERTDVWGLGAILFEVLTGRSPREEGPIQRPPPPVRSLVPECPGDLAALCDKALAASRDARYPSAEALALDLDAWLHGRPVTAHAYRPAELLKRFVSEHRVALSVGVVAVLALAALSVASFVRLRDERNGARAFGLAMLADVVPRMTSLGDAQFLTRLTGRVQEWLEAAGSGEDDAAVARSWMRLAVNADYQAQTDAASRFAERCLGVARVLPSERERYAIQQTCQTIKVENDRKLTDAQRAAAIDALRAVAPPADAWDDPRTVEARLRLAVRQFRAVNDSLDREAERAAIREVLTLSARWLELEPGDPTAAAAHVDAQIDAAIASSNQGDPVAALEFSNEAVASARALLKTDRSEATLARLAEALFIEVTTRRWYAQDTAEARARLEKDALAAIEAQLVLQPESVPARVSRLALLLETAQFELLPGALPPWEHLSHDSSSIWLFGMLAAGKSQEALTRTAWLERTNRMDMWIAFALMAAEQGDYARAAGWARDAVANLTSSVWMIDGMHRWATERTGPAAPALQRFEKTMSAAHHANDEAGVRSALLGLANDLEQLEAP